MGTVVGAVVGRGAPVSARPAARPRPASRVHLVVALLALASLGAACSDTDFSSSAPDAGEVEVGDLPRPSMAGIEDGSTVPGGSDATDGTVTGATDGDLGAGAIPGGEPGGSIVPGDTTPGVTVAPTGTTIAPQLPTVGVPGVDSTNVICASWARLVGTRQVLTVAANLGGLDDVRLARLEVVAAPFVLEAIQRLDGGLEEVGGDVWAERDVVMEDLLGRMDARADAALSALEERGPADGTAVLLSQVWLDALRRLDPGSTLPPLADLGPQLGPLVEQAAATFATDAPRWNQDPALDVTGVEYPATQAFVDRTCPDLTALGIGDAV